MHHRAKRSGRRASPRRSGATLLASVLALSLAACLEIAAPAAAASGPLAQTPDGRPLQMTFEDQFDSFRPWRDGRGVWRTEFKDGRSDDPFELRTLRGNKELQLYVDPAMPLKGGRGAEHAAALDP